MIGSLLSIEIISDLDKTKILSTPISLAKLALPKESES